MYTWIKGEEITAAKLNAMQHRPNMDAVNRSGLGFGGLDDSALSDDVICNDKGTWSAATPKRVTVTEHELGNMHYEYNHDNEVYQIKTGAAGVTGKVQKDAGTIGWFNGEGLDPNGKNYIWEKISTDYWGNPTKIERCVSSCGGLGTQMWDPARYTVGTVWRRIGTIEKDCRFSDVGSNATWAYNAVNENNAFALPVARRWGWDSGSNTLVAATTTDIQNRYPQSKWAATVLNDNGLTVPIQGVGELGGVKIYNTFCGNTDEDNRMGIGIAAGVEFYDPTSYNLYYNCICTRPKPTSACIPLGPEGKYGHIRIDAINPFSPWQFMLSGELDIGSGGGWDPGSHWIDCIPLADGPICGTRSYYGWEGRFWQPPGLADMRHGLVDGSVTRLSNREILWTGQFRSWCATYRPGEINCGGIGIGTAQFEWVSEFKKDDPFDGCVTSNRNGGLITGIMNDSACRYTIDQNGFIHAPNPDWMGKYGVNIPCANTELKNTVGGTGGAYPYYLWPAVDKSKWCHTQPQYNDGGRVSGEVVVINPNISTRQDTPQVYPDGNGNQYLWPQMGQVKEGVIGIPNAFFAAYTCIGGSENTAYMGWLTADPPVDELNYIWSPGVIRGVMSDIPWQHLHVNKNDEYTFPPEGEDWPVDELPSCVVSVEFFPEMAPYIDLNGILHLPSVLFGADKEEVTCCGTTKTKLVNFMPYEQPFTYKEPIPPSGTNQSSDENQGEEGGGINPGGAIGGGGGYVPMPRT